MTSLSGWLLVGTGEKEVVVLIAYHNETGAFGVCLNDPSDSAWQDVFGDEISAKVKALPVLVGGPEKADKPWVLHPVVEGIEFDNSVTCESAQVTLSLDGLGVAASGDFGEVARLGFGVYQWQAGELEEAVQAQNDWQIIPASEALLFGIEQNKLYQTCMQIVAALGKKMDGQS